MINKIQSLRPFTRFMMTIGELPTSYLVSMTYEEQLLWFCNYLEKTVIPTINNNGEAVIELQNLYAELKEYVDNYFNNLDVQEEINNKLDEMAESGQLAEIISQYLDLACLLVYDTLEDMKQAVNLTNGSITKTLGYHTINDNGGALYKIREIKNTDVINNGDIVSLNDDTLVAELIYNKSVNVKTFGVIGDGITDDTVKLQNAITYSSNKNLILNNEVYLISNSLNLSNTNITGNSSTIKASSSFNSNYMINLSNSNTIKNIIFDNNNYSISTSNSNATDDYVLFDNCEFIHTKQYTDANNFALNNAINLTAKESIIKNSKIYDNLSHGIRLISSQLESNAIIDNCKIYNNGNYNNTLITACGLANYSREIGLNYNQVIIQNCESYNNGNTGFAIHSLNNCSIINCYSHNNLEHGITLMDGQNGIITNCILKDNTAYGVRIQGDYLNLDNGGYKDFIVKNNIFIGNSGIHLSNNVENGFITENIFNADITGITRFGIVIGDDDLLNDVIKNITIKDNKFNGISYLENTRIYPYFVLDESNEIDELYTINGNMNNTYITPKLRYSNNYDNLNTSFTDLTSWTIPGTLTDNTITPSDGIIARKNFAISSTPSFINILMDIETYSSKIGVGIRFRDSNNSLITLTRISDSYSTNVLTAKTKFNCNLLSKIFDMTKWTFSTTPSYYEIFLESDSNIEPITINAIYTSCSNENTIINSL